MGKARTAAEVWIVRIQQIQLLGRDMRGSEHDRLWNQLEAEIHLHRHKTVIRACRGRGRSKTLPAPLTASSRRSRGSGEPRRILLPKDPSEGLGISITVPFLLPRPHRPSAHGVLVEQGGKEHGVPILVSEIHPGQPAERCGKLFVGDAILSVNGTDLRAAKHAEAVAVLSSQVPCPPPCSAPCCSDAQRGDRRGTWTWSSSTSPRTRTATTTPPSSSPPRTATGQTRGQLSSAEIKFGQNVSFNLYEALDKIREKNESSLSNGSSNTGGSNGTASSSPPHAALRPRFVPPSPVFQTFAASLRRNLCSARFSSSWSCQDA